MEALKMLMAHAVAFFFLAFWAVLVMAVLANALETESRKGRIVMAASLFLYPH